MYRLANIHSFTDRRHYDAICQFSRSYCMRAV